MSHDRAVPETEIMASPPTLATRARARWSALPRRRRAAVAVPAAVLVAVLTAGVAVRQGQHWLAERSRRDDVALTATTGVWASSTTPVGGSIDFFVSVRNTGPRRVRIESVDSRESRMTVRSRRNLHYEVLPGTAVDVPVSVRLDCAGTGLVPGPGDEAGPLRATIAADPLSGRRRTVHAPLARSPLLTHVADTLCAIRPGLRGKELSGPVV
jgi:hypothetical protein